MARCQTPTATAQTAPGTPTDVTNHTHLVDDAGLALSAVWRHDPRPHPHRVSAGVGAPWLRHLLMPSTRRNSPRLPNVQAHATVIVSRITQANADCSRQPSGDLRPTLACSHRLTVPRSSAHTHPPARYLPCSSIAGRASGDAAPNVTGVGRRHVPQKAGDDACNACGHRSPHRNPDPDHQQAVAQH